MTSAAMFAMELQLPTLPGGVPGTVYTIAGVFAATVVISELINYHKLDRIPTIGSNGWFGSWWAARKFKSNAHLLIQEGYRKYKASLFKVADPWRWVVLVNSRRHIEELRKAPDDALSLHDAANASMKLDLIMGPEIMHNPYHVEVIRGNLTRKLSDLYPEIRDEISVAFDEILDLGENEWKTVFALSTIQKVVCRAAYSGVTGRDPDWIDINVRYTMDLVKGGKQLRRFANFLAPVVVRFMTDVPTSKKRAMKHLAPMIEERLKLLEEHGNNYDGLPNDMLSWLLREAPEGAQRTIRSLTDRILIVNFAAIHTSSNSFVHALFFLAENPQYVQPLREEVEAIVQKEGWSKASLGKMRKIDSFMKESQRMIGLGSIGLVRMALKDFTFSDGTFIPKGTFVGVSSGPLHSDDELYENAHVFDPFRFSRVRDESDGEGTKHHFTSTSPEYLVFGHGKHACPGRFFASNELKSMLAHVVVTYDVKLQDNKPRSEGLRDGAAILADPSAKIMFRKRAY